MLKWIFFDVGNVILNDDPTLAQAYRFLYQSLIEKDFQITFNELMEKRYNIMKSMEIEQTGPYFQILGEQLLGKDDWIEVFAKMAAEIFPRWKELNPLIPGIPDVINKLKENYRLGIIANQPSEAIEILKGHNLWDHFEVAGISSEVGYHKPDPDFFTWALKEAGCQAEEALMIGDRIDNDIIPAKRIGFKTIWLKIHPLKKGFDPRDEYEKVYLNEKVRTYDLLRQPQGNHEEPDFTADAAADILEGIERILSKTDK